MNILSLFVLIPLLMLLGLWIARNVNPVSYTHLRAHETP